MTTNRSLWAATTLSALVLAVTLGFVLLFAFGSWALGMAGTGSMGGGMMGGTMGMAPFWLFGFLLFSILVLSALGYAGMRAARGDGESSSADETSDEETDSVTQLRERYVGGELTEDEFERDLERVLDGNEGRATDGATRPAADRSEATEKR